MNREQFSLFEAWYKYYAKEGAEWFVVTLLGGLGLLKQEARFTQQFEAKLLNGYLWEITSELEVRDRPTLSDGALAILLENDFDRLSSAVNHLHYFVHVECPQYIEDLDLTFLGRMVLQQAAIPILVVQMNGCNG